MLIVERSVFLKLETSEVWALKFLSRGAPRGRRMTGSASQAMDVVFRLLPGEKIVGRGSRGREGLGAGTPPEAGG